MALSRLTFIGDGSTTQFSLGFPLGILSRDDVTCRVGSEVDGLGAPLYRTLTWVTDTLVEISGATPEMGVPILFERTVVKDELQHAYENGVPIEASNLDDSNKQAMMAVHEVLDGRFATLTQDLDAGTHKITNLVGGTAPTDAATYGQLVSMTGDAPSYASIASAAAGVASSAQSAAETAADRAELAASILPLNNYTATTDPTISDDISAGYTQGSEWINVTSGDNFLCTDNTLGAAVWVSLVTDLSALKSGAYETVANIRLIPQQSESADYTLVLTDAGKHILHPSADTTGRTFTIPANSSVAFPIGTAITIVNQDGAGVLTIDITTDTLVLAGAGTTGSRTLAANGIATILKITSTIWMISGIGLT